MKKVHMKKNFFCSLLLQSINKTIVDEKKIFFLSLQTNTELNEAAEIVYEIC